MNKQNIKTLMLLGLAQMSLVNAGTIHYTENEIAALMTDTSAHKVSTDYNHQYFSHKQPDTVIEQLMKADMSPLVKEYTLYNILTEISQRPPQDFHQNFVDSMKSYAAIATKTAEEGHLESVVFNLRSKAYGIENIWQAYRSEQKFSQLFSNNVPAALAEVKIILTQESHLKRPLWLGLKNSIAVLPAKPLSQLINHLKIAVEPNSGVDALISHVGLLSGEIELIEKAMQSDQQHVRELTLRSLMNNLPHDQVKSLLINHTQAGLDRKFSTALLVHFSGDYEVENVLFNQLNDKKTAANAAYALSQFNQASTTQRIKKQFIQTSNLNKKKYLIMALKLNSSNESQLALNDLQRVIKPNSTEAKWLKSFLPSAEGAQR